MTRMSAALHAWVAMLAAAMAACASLRLHVRLGSLVPSHRSLEYDPGILSWKLVDVRDPGLTSPGSSAPGAVEGSLP